MLRKRITMSALILLLFTLAGCLTKDSTTFLEDKNNTQTLYPEIYQDSKLVSTTDSTSASKLSIPSAPIIRNVPIGI